MARNDKGGKSHGATREISFDSARDRPQAAGESGDFRDDRVKVDAKKIRGQFFTILVSLPMPQSVS